MIPQVKKPDIGGPRLAYQSYTWFAVEAGRLTAKFSKTTLEVVYGTEINIQFSGNSSVEHYCSQHANCMLPQLEASVAFYCVHILE
jgi:hypothetical protein